MSRDMPDARPYYMCEGCRRIGVGPGYRPLDACTCGYRYQYHPEDDTGGPDWDNPEELAEAIRRELEEHPF